MSASTQHKEQGITRAAYLEQVSFPRHLDGFLSENSSWKSRYNAYQNMRTGVSQNTFHLLIDAAVELSLLSPDRKAADDLLLEATEQLAQYEARSVSTAPAMRVTAAMLRSNIPLLVCMFAEHEQPSVSAIEEAHTYLANELIETHRAVTAKRKDISRTKMQSYVGIAAEAATLVRLQRFATEEVRSGGWTPTTALMSQNRYASRSHDIKSSWDLSIFTDIDDVHSPAHKIQVKWGDSDAQYDEDISVVNAKYDLLLPGERTLSLGRFIYESCAAPQPNVHSFRPSARTELLLNAIE